MPVLLSEARLRLTVPPLDAEEVTPPSAPAGAVGTTTPSLFSPPNSRVGEPSPPASPGPSPAAAPVPTEGSPIPSSPRTPAGGVNGAGAEVLPPSPSFARSLAFVQAFKKDGRRVAPGELPPSLRRLLSRVAEEAAAPSAPPSSGLPSSRRAPASLPEPVVISDEEEESEEEEEVSPPPSSHASSGSEAEEEGPSPKRRPLGQRGAATRGQGLQVLLLVRLPRCCLCCRPPSRPTPSPGPYPS